MLAWQGHLRRIFVVARLHLVGVLVRRGGGLFGGHEVVEFDYAAAHKGHEREGYREGNHRRQLARVWAAGIPEEPKVGGHDHQAEDGEGEPCTVRDPHQQHRDGVAAPSEAFQVAKDEPKRATHNRNHGDPDDVRAGLRDRRTGAAVVQAEQEGGVGVCKYELEPLPRGLWPEGLRGSRRGLAAIVAAA
ncbi:hypothetical protein THAOC_30720, partial [Thalassiosira oceanica]